MSSFQTTQLNNWSFEGNAYNSWTVFFLDEDGDFDIAMFLHCKSWITPAIQWITRSNNGWPGEHVKAFIVQHGTLFVPIGVKGSINEDLEWRI